MAPTQLVCLIPSINTISNAEKIEVFFGFCTISNKSAINGKAMAHFSIIMTVYKLAEKPLNQDVNGDYYIFMVLSQPTGNLTLFFWNFIGTYLQTTIIDFFVIQGLF